MNARRWAALAAAALSACRSETAGPDAPPPVAVRCVAPKAEAVQDSLSVRGRVEPPPGGSLTICAQAPGRVASVAVHEGDRVAVGDVVATIADPTVRDAARQAQASLVGRRAALDNARATLERVRAVVERGVNASQDLDDALTREKTAQASFDAAKAAADQARHTLGLMLVRSGLDGVVTRVWRGAGALVDGTPATPILDLTASGGTEFVAEVTEPDLVRIEVGASVHGQLESGAGFEGIVSARPASLDSSTGLGVVRIAIAEPKTGLVTGAFGRARISSSRRTATVLPVAALRGAVSDGAEVAVCDHDRIQLRKVAVGYRDDARFELLDGIAANEKVAVDHVLGLEDGAAIRVLP